MCKWLDVKTTPELPEIPINKGIAKGIVLTEYYPIEYPQYSPPNTPPEGYAALKGITL